MNIPNYAEIGITTNFSFLRGGSDPRAYVHQASELGIPAIGIADHNTLAGVVRAYKELENPEVTHKPKLLIGTRLVSRMRRQTVRPSIPGIMTSSSTASKTSAPSAASPFSPSAACTSVTPFGSR